MSKYLLGKISINFAVFICAMVGVIATSFGVSGLMTGVSILYYTVQSNIWIGLTSLTFAILQIIGVKKSSVVITGWLYVTKYVFVVAITLTMVVFWLLLAPTIQLPSYLLSPSNLFAHTLTPILSLASFSFFDSRDYKLSKKSSFFSLATPLYYFIFAVVCSLAGVPFHVFRMPYFFIDFYEFGWFSASAYSSLYTFSSFGVFYWIIIILLCVFLLGFGLLFLNRYIYAKQQKDTSVASEKTL